MDNNNNDTIVNPPPIFQTAETDNEKLSFYEQKDVKGKQVVIVGYPWQVRGDQGAGSTKRARETMYSDQNKIEEVITTLDGHGIVKYEVDTSEGQSGASLQVYDSNQRLSCVGVHCGNMGGAQGINVGALFTKRVIDHFFTPTLKNYTRLIMASQH